MIAGHNWSDLEFQRPSMATAALSADELERARRRAYLPFYARASRRIAGPHLRDLPKLGSMHEDRHRRRQLIVNADAELRQ
jgi:hypothetical protein